MPNWCENRLEIKGSKKNVENFINDFREKGFECVMPIPNDLKDTNKVICWYNENWGTKGIGGEIVVKGNAIYFDTAWSPPSKAVLVKISEKYGVDLKLIYIESGCAFEGLIKVKKGIVTRELYIPNYTNPDFIEEMLEIEGDEILDRLETDADIIHGEEVGFEKIERLFKEKKWNDLFNFVYQI